MNVVVVDNDVALARSFEIILRQHGHRVISFCNPVRAAEYLIRSDDTDVLIVDYLMGEMNGCELLKKIGRRITTSCKVIMITGHLEEIGPKKIVQALGVHHLIKKPVDINHICEMVEC